MVLQLEHNKYLIVLNYSGLNGNCYMVLACDILTQHCCNYNTYIITTQTATIKSAAIIITNTFFTISRILSSFTRPLS